jgi:hypothetical protein
MPECIQTVHLSLACPEKVRVHMKIPYSIDIMNMVLDSQDDHTILPQNEQVQSGHQCWNLRTKENNYSILLECIIWDANRANDKEMLRMVKYIRLAGATHGGGGIHKRKILT